MRKMTSASNIFGHLAASCRSRRRRKASRRNDLRCHGSSFEVVACKRRSAIGLKDEIAVVVFHKRFFSFIKVVLTSTKKVS